MKILGLTIGLGGCLCLVISIILTSTREAWAAPPEGWWKISMTLLITSIGLLVVSAVREMGTSSSDKIEGKGSETA